MFEYNARLVKRHAWEPLDELMDGCVIFQVLEERRHRHARASEDPGAADASRVKLDGCARGPIDHEGDASTGTGS